MRAISQIHQPLHGPLILRDERLAERNVSLFKKPRTSRTTERLTGANALKDGRHRAARPKLLQILQAWCPCLQSPYLKWLRVVSSSMLGDER